MFDILSKKKREKKKRTRDRAVRKSKGKCIKCKKKYRAAFTLYCSKCLF